MNRKVVTFGEIMLRLAAPRRERFDQVSGFEVSYCGAEANVAASLARFGVPVEFVTRVPDNGIALAAADFLRKEGIGTNFWLRGGARLGTFYLETGSMQRPSKVIYDRAGSAFAEILPGMIDWQFVFSGVSWFHWSGITAGVSASAAAVCGEAVRAARAAGVTVSCDLNFRRQLWGYGRKPSEVMEELVDACDVVLANEEDCGCFFGIGSEGTVAGAATERCESVCSRMLSRFPRCRVMAFTLRDAVSADRNFWSGALCVNGVFHLSVRYELADIVDRVGAGDSFAAGLIRSFLERPDDAQGALAFAVAASALKHSIHGDFNRVSVADVEVLLKGDGSGRIRR